MRAPSGARSRLSGVTGYRSDPPTDRPIRRRAPILAPMPAVQHTPDRRPFTVWLAAILAFAMPSLLVVDSLPLSSLPTDVAALVGAGAWMALVADRSAARGRTSVAEPGLRALFALLALLAAAALAGALWGGSPPRLVVRQAAVLVAAALALAAGARLMQVGASGRLAHLPLIRVLLWAILCAGLLNAALAVAQYVVPGWGWVSLNDNGRAVGHLRQPNHLATQLLWGLVALAALRELTRLHGAVCLAAGALLIVALAMSGSRTGALACLLPAVWGLADRRLAGGTRVALAVTPLALALCWWGVAAFPPELAVPPTSALPGQRLGLQTSRWGLWQQSLRLIEQNPWLGVGWGQFGFAWTLTPMAPIARSPNETFTHAHNLLLQWAVELGLPLAVVATALLAVAMGRAFVLAGRAEGPEAAVRSAAVAMLAVLLLHSLLEYPLWHAHFLLPAAVLAGLALGRGATSAAASRRRRLPPTVIGGGVALVALLVLLDYQPVARIYAPADDGLTDVQRRERARESVLFGQFGDRFAGTLAPVGHRQLAPYREIVFEHLDLQLLLSWTLAHAEAGEVDKARYLAARLKEFDRPMVTRFFEVCATPQAAQAFQCTAPPPGIGFRDFR